MRILHLGLSVPNMNKFHNLFTELMAEFRNNGHEVMIVGPAFDKEHVGIQLEDNIPTLRVPTLQLFNVGIIAKGIATLLLPWQYKKALKRHSINLDFDLVIMPTPPITLVNVARWLKKKHKTKVYLILRDIFPQNAVDLKMMKKGGPAYLYFRGKEKKLYATSDHIGCMSPKNVSFVVKNNPSINHDKLHLLPNWSSLQPLQGHKENLELKKEYGLENKFIVIFGGNIGKPQKMENIVALAKSCSDIKDIFFLIIGGGNEKEKLQTMVKSEGIKNMQVKDYLSKGDFFKVLQMADVGLISLSQDFTIPNIPSKSLAYFNAKKPILASVDRHTDFGVILENLNAGLWAEAGNTELLKEKLLSLYNDEEKCRAMGKNGYNYMKDFLLTTSAYRTIINKVGQKSVVTQD